MRATNHGAIRAAMAAERMRLLLMEFDQLPDSLEMSRSEVSVIVNRSISTLKAWARDPDHPIKWRQRGKQLATTVAHVRAFLRTEPPRRGRPPRRTTIEENITTTR
jgi:hypothetical protein